MDETNIEIRPRGCFGRKVLYASYKQEELNDSVIKEIINKVFPIHLFNWQDIYESHCSSPVFTSLTCSINLGNCI